MKFTLSAVAFLIILNLAAAYPSTFLRGLDLTNLTAADHELIKREIENEKVKARSLGFDAGAQYIKTTGTNKFVPPNFAVGDQRGELSLSCCKQRTPRHQS